MRRLRRPIFVVGFNNSGKSTLTETIAEWHGAALYPGEGNAELWFPTLYPWISSTTPTGPIWHDPNRFLAEAARRRKKNYGYAKAVLGAYQWLTRSDVVLNDSGMLAALLPEVGHAFADARFIHVVRDDRLSSFITAQLEWARMLRSPGKYALHGCSLDFRDVLWRMSRYCRWTRDRVREFAEVASDRLLEVRIEDWHRSPSVVMDRIAAFMERDSYTARYPYAAIASLDAELRAAIPRCDLDIIESVLNGSTKPELLHGVTSERRSNRQ